jgi:hypothetical protein
MERNTVPDTDNNQEMIIEELICCFDVLMKKEPKNVTMHIREEEEMPKLCPMFEHPPIVQADLVFIGGRTKL